MLFASQMMNQYLLRDGSRVSIASDPSGYDVYSYETPAGRAVHAVFSLKAERELLRSVDLNQLLNGLEVDYLCRKEVVA